LGGSEVERAKKDGSKYMDQMAEIVIYPQPGPETDKGGKSLGRRNLEMALAAITEATRDLEGISNGKTPRENAKINDLVFIAQAGGDLKKILKSTDMIDEYFDKDTEGNYSMAKGEKLPTAEELKAATEALSERGAEIKQQIEAERQQIEAGLLVDAQENILKVGGAIQKHKDLTQIPQDTPPLMPPKKGFGAKIKGWFGKK
jgi:hypothetical protein